MRESAAARPDSAASSSAGRGVDEGLLLLDAAAQLGVFGAQRRDIGNRLLDSRLQGADLLEADHSLRPAGRPWPFRPRP